MKRITLTALLLLIPIGAMGACACPPPRVVYASPPVVYQQPTVVYQTGPSVYDVIDTAVYISSGVNAVMGNYYNVRRMGYRDRHGYRPPPRRYGRGGHRPVHYRPVHRGGGHRR